MSMIETIDAALGLLTALAVAALWLRDRARNRRVEIVVTSNGDEIVLPVPVLSGSLSRAEILGLLGTFAQGRRFNLENPLGLLPQLESAQRGLSKSIRCEVDAETFSAISTSVGQYYS